MRPYNRSPSTNSPTGDARSHATTTASYVVLTRTLTAWQLSGLMLTQSPRCSAADANPRRSTRPKPACAGDVGPSASRGDADFHPSRQGPLIETPRFGDDSPLRWFTPRGFSVPAASSRARPCARGTVQSIANAHDDAPADTNQTATARRRFRESTLQAPSSITRKTFDPGSRRSLRLLVTGRRRGGC